VSSSGGAHSKHRKATPGSQSPAKADASASTSRAASQNSQSTGTAKTTKTAESAPAAQAATPTANAAAVAPTVMSAASSTTPSTTSQVGAPQAFLKAVVSPIGTVLNDVVAPLLSAFLGSAQGGPMESPLAWVFLAAARRQLGVQGATATTSTVAAVPTTTSLTLATAAVTASSVPTVSPTFGTPDPVTGTVTGALNASEPGGNTLTYALTTPPTSGTLAFNTTNATFTYTPTTAARIAAGITSGVDTIAMTVTVSDGTNTVPATVNIPVSPTAVAKSADIGVTSPGAVVATNNRVYVANKAAGTVTVIDATNNTVIGTIAVGATPDGLTIKPDGTRLYVSSTAGNTVTVVNTATSAVVTTVAVADPSATAINSSGSTLYVANLNEGTVTKITTTTNAVSGTVTLPAGFRPTGIAVSPDKTKIVVIGTKADGTAAAASFALSSTTATAINGVTGAPTGLAVSPDSSKYYITSSSGANSTVTIVNSATRAVLGTYAVGGVLSDIAVSNDGSTLVVTDTSGKVTALNAATGATLSTATTRSTTTPTPQLPSLALSPAGTTLYLTDLSANTVHVVSLVGVAQPPPTGGPTIGAPTIGAPDASTGAIAGAVNATDANSGPLTYTVTGAPTKGSVVLNTDGTFTYSPTAAARHAASTVGASTSLTTDSFTVSVSDPMNNTAATTITVNISPTNAAPTIKTTSPITSSSTGVVKAQVSGTDADLDPLSYTVSTAPAKGTLTIASGVYTYTPTATARHAAAKVGATTADKTDTFSITVSDGHGGTATTTVTVTVVGANSAPTSPTATITSVNTSTGTVTGGVTASDANGDTLTVTSTTPTKGTITINPSGTFSYTPTAAARQAASAPNALASAKTDAVTFTISDGYGGKTTVALSLPVTPYAAVGQPPSNVTVTVNNPTLAIGQVTGTVTATDPQGQTLTYTVTSAPTKGVVDINAATGTFSYVPDVASRYLAEASGGPGTDSFTVTISDTGNNTTTKAVTVTVAPPSSSPAAIDQRGTTVAMNVQELYFDSQADTNTALDLMKADGVTTIRMLIPWAGVEPTNNVYNWSAIDRVVTSATARGMTVLGVVDSTPTWAGVSGGAGLAAAPADPQQFAQFAGALATRYAGQISAYEIWNEPNGYQFWSPAPDAAAYTALLKAAYPAIKAADPNAEVIAAGLGAVTSFGNLTIDPVTYLQQMYAAGAQGYFDAVAYHPYLYTKLFSTPSQYASAPINQVQAMYALMVANGDGAKQIWATEYGQPSSVVSEQNQAAYINDFLTTWRTLPYAGPAFIDTIRDTGSANSSSSTLGVYHTDWTPKAAVSVIEEIILQNEAIIAAQTSSVSANLAT
jgi:YVTN family beta-propeller protein/VCBS repeat-containing protein